MPEKITENVEPWTASSLLKIQETLSVRFCHPEIGKHPDNRFRRRDHNRWSERTRDKIANPVSSRSALHVSNGDVIPREPSGPCNTAHRSDKHDDFPLLRV